MDVEQIRSLIQKDKLQDAIKSAQQMSSNFVKKIRYHQLAGRLTRIEEDINSGIISHEQYIQQRNQIRLSLLKEINAISPSRYFSFKSFIYFVSVIVLFFVGWTVVDSPVLKTPIEFNKNEQDGRSIKVIVRHHSYIKTNFWFYLANRKWTFWMKKRLIKVDNNVPRIIDKAIFSFTSTIEQNSQFRFIIYEGNNENRIIESKIVPLN